MRVRCFLACGGVTMAVVWVAFVVGVVGVGALLPMRRVVLLVGLEGSGHHYVSKVLKAAGGSRVCLLPRMSSGTATRGGTMP